MKLIRWNGERWWEDERSVVDRVVRWVLWPGGWETFRGYPLRHRLRPHYWTPFSLFGHRLTYFGWGVQWRVKGGYWVVSERSKSIYWSPNGTPDEATVWLRGGRGYYDLNPPRQAASKPKTVPVAGQEER